MARNAVRLESDPKLPRKTPTAGVRVPAAQGGKGMTEWSVTLGFEHAIPSDQITNKVDDLLEEMAPHHAAASFKDNSMTMQFTVGAQSVRAALDKGLMILLEALHEAGIKDRGVFAASAQLMERLDQELSMPNAPELIGVTELARLLKVSRQRASELARTGSGFPRPIAFLASGPVWDKSMIARYVAGWERRPKGRPKKAAMIPA